MLSRMKFGICSEIFQEWNDFDRACAYAASAGYEGIEIAPFTFAPHVTDIDAPTRAAIRRAAESAGIQIIGLHWLLVGPEGLHLTHPDASTRKRTAQYLRDLAAFCGEIGGAVMIFGSPKQRSLVDGITYEQAFDNAREVFEAALPECERRGVTLCMEQLSHLETDFCETVAQTVELVEAVGHPNFRIILDTKAMAFEHEDRPDLIRRYARHLAHYHANDTTLRGPGTGDTDFVPIFAALNEVGFGGFVSVEVFKFEEGPEAIADNSIHYMRKCLKSG